MVKWSEEEIVENIFKKFEDKKISLLAPLVRGCGRVGEGGRGRPLCALLRPLGSPSRRSDRVRDDLQRAKPADDAALGGEPRYSVHDG